MKINNTKIKQAYYDLQTISEEQKNMFLKSLARNIRSCENEILDANKKDIKQALLNNLSEAFIERLSLDEKGIQLIVKKLEDIQRLTNGLGKVIERRTVDQNIKLFKRRTSIGVIAVIYESRPEVTIDVAALCIKSGNAAILKGGSEAIYTNKVLNKCIWTALISSGISPYSVTFIADSDRHITDQLLRSHFLIDLVIARGGYELVEHVLKTSSIPVLAHSAGGARIYIDESADLAIVEKVMLNAKISKPSACNSLDTILIHRRVVKKIMQSLKRSLQAHKVTIVNNNTDWNKEFLSLSLNIKIVKSVDEAVKHIQQYSKKHSEGIIAINEDVIKYFTNAVDAAAVFVNCSTRLHDGYVFGLGSEMGIATGKLQARGPVGLKELTTYKWEVYGNGNIR